jgi:hypothetical protein
MCNICDDATVMQAANANKKTSWALIQMNVY